MPRSLALACVALAAIASAVAQQNSAPVSFSGVVINSVTGAPVRYAQVYLLPTGGDAETNASGAFRFDKVEPGTYEIMAGKTGFTSSPSDLVSLTASRENFRIGLTPLSSIRGRVRDDSGDPVEGATVLVMQSSIERGRRRNRIVNAVETNDQGEYRIPMLTAGPYVVKASGQFSRRSYYANNRPPAAARDSFSPVSSSVTLEPGGEARADLSVALQPGHTVRGRITNLKPHTSVDLQLSSGDEDLGITNSSMELVSGQFEIQSVLDGRYRLRAYQAGDGDQVLFAEQNVEVHGRNVEGLALALGAPPVLKGNLRVEGQHDKPKAFYAALDSEDPWLAASDEQRGRISRGLVEGAFEIPSVFPGKYWVDLHVDPGFYVSAARAGDQDLLATQEITEGPSTSEMEIVLRTDGGTVSGSVNAGEIQLVALLVPESCNRPAKLDQVDPDHTFAIADVAPGSYRLHVWKESANVEFGSPKALCALARGGTPVEVRAGQESKVQVTRLSEEPK